MFDEFLNIVVIELTGRGVSTCVTAEGSEYGSSISFDNGFNNSKHNFTSGENCVYSVSNLPCRGFTLLEHGICTERQNKSSFGVNKHSLCEKTLPVTAFSWQDEKVLVSHVLKEILLESSLSVFFLKKLFSLKIDSGKQNSPAICSNRPLSPSRFFFSRSHSCSNEHHDLPSICFFAMRTGESARRALASTFLPRRCFAFFARTFHFVWSSFSLVTSLCSSSSSANVFEVITSKQTLRCCSYRKNTRVSPTCTKWHLLLTNESLASEGETANVH